jgi:hypothetical protein
MHDLRTIQKRNHEIMVTHVEEHVSMVVSALEERDTLDPFLMEVGPLTERLDALEEERTSVSKLYDRLEELFTIALVNLAECIVGDRPYALRLVKERFTDKGIHALDAIAHGETFHIPPYTMEYTIDYGVSMYDDGGVHTYGTTEQARIGWSKARKERSIIERMVEISYR